MAIAGFRLIPRVVSVTVAALVTLLLAAQGCSGTSANTEDIVGAVEDPTGAVTAPLAVGTMLRATANANLRVGPSTGERILRVIPIASLVRVVESVPVDGYYRVDHNGTVGWAFGKYFQIQGSQAMDGGAAPQGDDAGVDAIALGDSGSSEGGVISSLRTEALERARSAVSFSYWWGHARWLPQGATSANRGTCAGNCPSCTHTGSYGADCSGLASKVWQIPAGNTDLTVDNHGPGTASYVVDTKDWSTVARGSVQPADAFVYNANGAGHIFLYASEDPWGSVYAYECKGCAEGCVYNLRTVGSAYHAIRRAGY